MFLRPEEIHKHHSLATVDIEKLKELLIKYVVLLPIIFVICYI